MQDIKPLLDKYYKGLIDPCSDYPIPICKYDIQETLKELKKYNIDNRNKSDIELLEQVIEILNDNNIPMTKVIYKVEV